MAGGEPVIKGFEVFWFDFGGGEADDVETEGVGEGGNVVSEFFRWGLHSAKCLWFFCKRFFGSWAGVC